MNEYPLSPHPLQLLLSAVLLVFVILTGTRENVNVALIWISLIPRNKEHLLRYFLSSFFLLLKTLCPGSRPIPWIDFFIYFPIPGTHVPLCIQSDDSFGVVFTLCCLCMCLASSNWELCFANEHLQKWFNTYDVFSFLRSFTDLCLEVWTISSKSQHSKSRTHPWVLHSGSLLPCFVFYYLVISVYPGESFQI